MKIWVARDKYGYLTLHEEVPFNNSGMWFSDNGTTKPYLRISKDCFPEVTYDNSPQEVELNLPNLNIIF
jgi:hypothetical protein